AKTWGLRIICVIFMLWGLASIAQANLIASYETSETSLVVTTPDLTLTPTIVAGNTAGAPVATEGTRVLKCTWTNQPDNKVEVKHAGLNFDLAGFNWLLVDIYTTTDLFAGSSNGVIGIWNGSWAPDWQAATSIPPAANQAIDVSGYTQTGLTQIQAFVLDHMSITSGTFYLDNIRTVVDIPLYRPAENPANTEQGLRYEYFTGQWTQLPEFEAFEPVEKGYVDNFDITGAPATDNFGYSFKGLVDIPSQGTYTFYTQSDDGSELCIGSNLVVDNNGTHASTESSGSIDLEAGLHSITVNYFDGTGPQELIVSYEGPGVSKTAIPDSILYKEVLSGDTNDDGRADLYDLAAIGEQWLSVYDITDVGLLADNWLEGVLGLQVKNGWLMIDGEKFFVKGIGYEDIRPGYDPGTQPFDAALITLDMNRILDGRFNTIRTWAALPEEELQLIDSLGLKIIFGIWIPPDGDYGNSAFITSTENDVRNTLATSKNYDSIITYVIMNEPQPDDIQAGGAAELVALWDRIKTIIHTEHPGVPVSFANTGWSKFVDMNQFDASVYNLYMYADDLKYSIGYTGWVEQHKTFAPDNPFIVSEYGLSVSPSGPGNYGYGGNTLTQQTEGNLYMYRSIIDGGGQGGCVFNYSDGWWKGTDPSTHDDHVEEWFGLIHFDGIAPADTEGTPRPVWEAYESYNACIVTSPKNGQIYDSLDIPLEFFPHSDVKTIRIKKDAVTVYEKPTNARSYIEDMLTLSFVEIVEDITLQFEFLDHSDTVIKTENIVVLYAQTPPTLPGFILDVPMDDLDSSATCDIQMTVDNPSVFTIKDDTIDYSFYPHSWVDARTADLSKILLNGDFSTGEPSNSFNAVGWNEWQSDGWVSRETNVNGITPTNPHYAIGNGSALDSGVWQVVNATAGNFYTLTFDAGSPDAWMYPVGEGRVEFLNATSAVIGTVSVSVDNPPAYGAVLPWKTYSISGTAPAGTTEIKVLLIHDNPSFGGTMRFDNVSLTTPDPYIWIFNDSFSIPAEVDMLTVSAGMTIQYGQFEKRLTRQKEIQRGTWANPICRKNTRNIPPE
ncbi:MAG: PA14 domain-containing protein, partial [Planctomycetota bacterium]